MLLHTPEAAQAEIAYRQARLTAAFRRATRRSPAAEVAVEAAAVHGPGPVAEARARDLTPAA